MLNKNLVMGSLLLLSSCHSGFGSSAQDIRTSAQNLRTQLVVDLPTTTTPEFSTQKIFTVADRTQFSTQIKLKNKNGFVVWNSNPPTPNTIQGKIIENLEPLEICQPGFSSRVMASSQVFTYLFKIKNPIVIF